jgi:hypothetical protein
LFFLICPEPGGPGFDLLFDEALNFCEARVIWEIENLVFKIDSKLAGVEPQFAENVGYVAEDSVLQRLLVTLKIRPQFFHGAACNTVQFRNLAFRISDAERTDTEEIILCAVRFSASHKREDHCAESKYDRRGSIAPYRWCQGEIDRQAHGVDIIEIAWLAGRRGAESQRNETFGLKII